MVVTLVVATFILLVLHDYYLQRRQAHALEATAQTPAETTAAPAFSPISTVGGFKAPANLAYHVGHAWAMREPRQLVRIGLDDFAAHLVGTVDQIELPARGRWLRQGERGWTIARGAHRFEMLSPIEGEVIDINPEVLRNPALAHDDPYGAGWLLAVQSPAADSNMKNLLHGRLAHAWMEQSASSLHARINPTSHAYLQDGGHPIADMLTLVPEPEWDGFVKEMLG
jgi:glycine cleavage system H protein